MKRELNLEQLRFHVLAFKQIDLYDPEVIIVCGTDTLQCMNRDLRLDPQTNTTKTWKL